MAVRKNFKLRIFSEEEFRQLEKDAVKFEQLAKRKERAKAKLRTRGGIFPDDTTTTNLPKSFVRKMNKSLLEREKTSAKGKNTKGAIVREDKIAKIESRLLKSEKSIKVLDKLFGKSSALIQGAISSPIGLAGSLGQQLLMKFLPAGIVITIATLAAEMWIESYGKGGPNDPRKPILDDVFTLIGLEEEIDYISGVTYFANSRTLTLNQDIVSNTANLRDGERRTRLINVQYGRA